MIIATVPISVNRVERASRLHQGNWNFIKRQAATIARAYAAYEPLKTFSYLALPFLVLGIVLLARALYIYLARNFGVVASNDQALIAGGVALIIGFVIFMFGLLADRIGEVRRLHEQQQQHAIAHLARIEAALRQRAAAHERGSPDPDM